mgnify:CR=1 FL=1
MILHIMGTMQSCVMTRAVFIKNAKAKGFFDGMNEPSEKKKQ